MASANSKQALSEDCEDLTLQERHKVPRKRGRERERERAKAQVCHLEMTPLKSLKLQTLSRKTFKA